jgi:hypothetical protein
MSIQTLINKYNSILVEYKKTYQDYINSLNLNSSDLYTVPNTFFFGDDILSVTQGSSVSSCKSSCLANTSCSGATYNTKYDNCAINSGDGNLVEYPNSTGIVHPTVYYSYKLENLNDQLISLNIQISNLISSNQTKYIQELPDIQEHHQIIQQNSHNLNIDKAKIQKMLNNYKKLNQNYDESELVLTSNYYTYIGLFLITILLVFLLIKFSISGQQSGGGNNFKNEAIFLFSIMVIFLFLSIFLKNYNSYIFISTILIAYIILKMKLKQ